MIYPSLPPAAMVLPRSVALIGMPAAGKSTLGAMLAERLQQIFVDSDRQMIRQSGLEIGQIFARCGEPVFRRYERCTIRGLIEKYPNGVLATGGGAYIQPLTRALLDDKCITVYLAVSLSTLQRRLMGDTTRPLLADPKTLAAMYDARTPIYERAQHTLNVDSGNLQEVLPRLIELLTPP